MVGTTNKHKVHTKLFIIMNSDVHECVAAFTSNVYSHCAYNFPTSFNRIFPLEFLLFSIKFFFYSLHGWKIFFVVITKVLFLTRWRQNLCVVVIEKRKYCFFLLFRQRSSFMIPASFIRSLHKFIRLTNALRSYQQSVRYKSQFRLKFLKQTGFRKRVPL